MLSTWQAAGQRLFVAVVYCRRFHAVLLLLLLMGSSRWFEEQGPAGCMQQGTGCTALHCTAHERSHHEGLVAPLGLPSHRRQALAPALLAQNRDKGA